MVEQSLKRIADKLQSITEEDLRTDKTLEDEKKMKLVIYYGVHPIEKMRIEMLGYYLL